MRIQARFGTRVTIFAIVLTALNLVGIVDFHFQRMVENDPFQYPVQITEISDDHVKLADGRSIWLAGGVDQWLREKISANGFRVDLQIEPEQQIVCLLGKKRHFICGTSMPPIVIPIIPRHVSAFGREGIGVGQFHSYVDDNLGSQSRDCQTVNPEI